VFHGEWDGERTEKDSPATIVGVSPNFRTEHHPKVGGIFSSVVDISIVDTSIMDVSSKDFRSIL
jgi:hypothetical protein